MERHPERRQLNVVAPQLRQVKVRAQRCRCPKQLSHLAVRQAMRPRCRPRCIEVCAAPLQ